MPHNHCQELNNSINLCTFEREKIKSYPSIHWRFCLEQSFEQPECLQKAHAAFHQLLSPNSSPTTDPQLALSFVEQIHLKILIYFSILFIKKALRIMTCEHAFVHNARASEQKHVARNEPFSMRPCDGNYVPR